MFLSGANRVLTLARFSFLLLALNVCSCSGGASGLYPVHGKVLYKAAPTAGILVTLHPVGADPKTAVSTGYTNDKGEFDVMTGQDSGAAAGEYVATLVWMVEAPGTKKKQPNTMTMTNEVNMVDKLKNKYGDRKNPAVTGINIKKGVNQLEPFKVN
ncbi:hypothetical protein BH10PLA2_BH10PLA2_19080 [soil metagenome]